MERSVLKQGAPRYFNSSPGVTSGFCATCGSPLTYENQSVLGEVHLYAASLADPSRVRAVFVEEQLPWLEIAINYHASPRRAAVVRSLFGMGYGRREGHAGALMKRYPNPSSALACQLSPAADIPSHILWPASCRFCCKSLCVFRLEVIRLL